MKITLEPAVYDKYMAQLEALPPMEEQGAVFDYRFVVD